MAFTNTYDTTFPADTQLANLLGADLRNFRVDTQQRMASISGLDAAKPRFDLDAQPANWNGILFFATDTGQIYKFANPAWTNVTANFIANRASLKVMSAGGITVTGTLASTQVASVVIPAGSMGTTGGLRITTMGLFEYVFSTGDCVEDITIGGTSIGSITTSHLASPSSGNIGVLSRRYCVNNGASNAQLNWSEKISNPIVFGGANPSSTAIDTSVNQTLRVNYINTTTNFTSIFYALFVEFF